MFKISDSKLVVLNFWSNRLLTRKTIFPGCLLALVVDANQMVSAERAVAGSRLTIQFVGQSKVSTPQTRQLPPSPSQTTDCLLISPVDK
jgi:hypothetical protein